MTNTHTPAPWFKVWNGHYWEIQDTKKVHTPSKMSISIFFKGLVSDEKNADLVAAAPELLKDLKYCLKCELVRRKKLLNKSTAAAYSDKRILRIKATIAKAEGKDHA